MFFLATLLISFLTGVSQNEGIPASTNISRSAYPMIFKNNQVLFRAKAPDVQGVQVDLGENTTWLTWRRSLNQFVELLFK